MKVTCHMLIYSLTILILNNCGSSKEDINELKRNASSLAKECAKILEDKNRNMMGGDNPSRKPVGNWWILDDIKVEALGENIEVTYYVNGLFTHERRQGLDTMQKAFANSASECKGRDVHTYAETK